MTVKLGVLISGSGTNLQAIVDAVAAGTLDAEVPIVVSSRSDAYGLKRAAAAGIQTYTVDKQLYRDDPLLADSLIAGVLKGHGVDYVAMAGYMRMVREPLLTAFPNRVVNLHPALLPSFQGAHAIQEAWERGVKVTGVTVHFANEEYDRGPIIAQQAVAVDEGMTLEALEARIHEVEHVLYPQTLQLIAEGRVHVTADNRVAID
jgi:phosphoribosylglycinamide formyltransferase-1